MCKSGTDFAKLGRTCLVRNVEGCRLGWQATSAVALVQTPLPRKPKQRRLTKLVRRPSGLNLLPDREGIWPTDLPKNDVLVRADEDVSLGEHARLVVLAALESPEDLAEVLGGAGASAHVSVVLAMPESSMTPVGTHLESITVRGFRGIGPKVTVPCIRGLV